MAGELDVYKRQAFLRKEAYGFMKKNVVIIGLGLIGGSLAKAFQKYSECSVSGMDRDPAVLEAALKSGAIDGVAGEKELREADILYLCLYPQADIDFIQAHGSQI